MFVKLELVVFTKSENHPKLVFTPTQTWTSQPQSQDPKCNPFFEKTFPISTSNSKTNTQIKMSNGTPHPYTF
jgi:hypothetical protein